MSALPRTIAAALAVPALLLGLLGAGASAAHAATGDPVYGPYSDPAYGLKGRVSPSYGEQEKTFVQVKRIPGNTQENIGDRQARLQWRVADGRVYTSSVRTLAKGERTTFVTTRVPCGKKIRVTIGVRGRIASTDDWSAWQEATYRYTRVC